VAIVEHDIQLKCSTFDVLGSLSILPDDKMLLKEFHQRGEPVDEKSENNHVQLSLICVETRVHFYRISLIQDTIKYNMV